MLMSAGLDECLEFELYEHQRRVVEELVRLEDMRVRVVGDVRMVSSGVLLSQPPGSGKTLEILALIILRPIPRPVERVFPFCGGVVSRFAESAELLKCTLVVVGPAVLMQWESDVGKYTDLRVLVVGRLSSLEKFKWIIANGEVGQYDMILLKNGNVSRKGGGRKMYYSIVDEAADASRGKYWARVVYDDFDILRAVTKRCRVLDSLSSVFVSATARYGGSREELTFSSVGEMFGASRKVEDVFGDERLFSEFAVRTEDGMLDRSVRLPLVEIYVHICENGGKHYMNLLSKVGTPDSDEVLEMLNGDAVETAAGLLGIKVSSVGEIFRRVLNRKYVAYMNSSRMMSKVEELRAQLVNGREGEYSRKELEMIRVAVAGSGKVEGLDFTEGLDNMLEKMEADYRAEKDKCGMAMARVVENVKEGECQICRVAFGAGCAMFVVRCCGITVCEFCGVKGSRIGRHRKGELTGVCANCRCKVSLKDDFIFIGSDFGVERLLEVDGGGATVVRHKLDLLMKIVRGEAIGQRVDKKIAGLLPGDVDKPQSAGSVRKVLIFAGYEETLACVEGRLVENGIVCLKLQGKYQNIDNVVKVFRGLKKGPAVLLVNSKKNCAGLNLEFCTDLVFYHVMGDKSAETQIAGRIHRIGRLFNARVHYVAYEDEK